MTRRKRLVGAGSSRASLALLVLVVLGALVASPAAGRSSSAASRRPVVLLIHGGAWLFGSPRDELIPAQVARNAGLQPVLVRYPLGDTVKAYGAVRRVAAEFRGRGRTVVAYGESVGGTMAEMLASECRVDLAVGNSSPSDLIDWPEGDNAKIWDYLGGGDIATRRALSPYRQEFCRPVLAVHSPSDEVVSFGFAKRYARKFPGVRLRVIPGGHLGEPRAANVRVGIAWLARQARLARFRLEVARIADSIGIP